MISLLGNMKVNDGYCFDSLQVYKNYGMRSLFQALATAIKSRDASTGGSCKRREEYFPTRKSGSPEATMLPFLHSSIWVEQALPSNWSLLRTYFSEMADSHWLVTAIAAVAASYTRTIYNFFGRTFQTPCFLKCSAMLLLLTVLLLQ